MKWKPVLLLALMYVVLGPLLFFVESQWVSGLPVRSVACGIWGMAVAFFVFSCAEMALTERYRRTQPGALTGLYVACKGLRFVLSVSAVVAYGILGAGGMLLFSVNIMMFYLATMLFMTVYTVRGEKKQ